MTISNRRHWLNFYLATGLAAFLLAPSAFAQNTGGVFGADVTPNTRALDWRVTFAPGSDGRSDRLASRVHYQQTVTDDIRLRAVVQGSDKLAADSDFDFAFVQLEAQWQFLENEEAGWDSALRLDLQLAEGRADFLGLNWTSDFQLSEAWRLRGVLLTGVQLGSQRRDGLFLQTRSSLSYDLGTGTQLQVQSFNIFGSTDAFGDLNDQNHSVGPAVVSKFGRRWTLEASVLFGVTDATANADFRMFISRSL